jgi:S1-C subfamily serine protease
VHKKKQSGWILLLVLGCVSVLGGTGYAFMNLDKQHAATTETLAEADSEIDVVPEKEVVVIEKPDIKPSRKVPKEKEKTELIEETQPKVFTIKTAGGFGSGFLYAKGGLIVTNAHVVAGYTDVVVRNSVGREAPGKVIGISGKYDVALIRAEAYKDVAPLKTEMAATKVGTEVIALGSPTGLENSASIGYLTGTDRHFENEFIYEKAYQVDVQIESGSSGGPLIDAKTGKVIGINSIVLNENRRFGFSIPLNSMTSLVDGWIASPMTDRQVAAVFGVYESYKSEETYEGDSYDDDSDGYEEYGGDVYFFEDWLEEFILTFRNDYEIALSYEDFYMIEPYLLPGDKAYKAFVDYFDEISGEGMYFEFLENSVIDVVINESNAFIYTYETFNFRNRAGKESYYEKEKVYEVVIDAAGDYKIKNVSNR